MKHITIERAKLEQWLKAVDMFAGEDRQKALHEAGKEMLQALAAPVQEPVAYRGRLVSGNYWYCNTPQFFDNAEPLYTTPPAAPVPLTDDIWILTSEYNDYDQHGEYFEAVFIGKPTAKQIEDRCGVNELGSTHILSGGGRIKFEYHWYNLRQEKAAHNITKGNAA
jgi:hypothetical protein